MLTGGGFHREGRPYKQAMSREETLNQLVTCAGSHFDPVVAKIAIHILWQSKPGTRYDIINLHCY